MALSTFDVVVVGANFGGVAAALAAARYGKRVALVAAGGNVGGQGTAQGVTRWDESEHVITPNTYGSTTSYQLLKDDIRGWYRANAALAPGVDGHAFNPGCFDAGHPFAADSNVVQTVLRALLSDFEDQLQLMLDRRVSSVESNAGVITSLVLDNGDSLAAPIFVDATDLGDLLSLANVAWVIGAEARNDTEEPHAESLAHPGHIQPITIPIAVERRPEGEKHAIPQPAGYSEALIEAQGFGVYNHRNGMIGGVFTSAHSDHPEWETLFDYRKYIDHRNFSDARYATDRSTINVGCNDYQAAVVPTGDAAVDAATVESARAASIAYLYWLQTQAPRDDGSGYGYPNLMVRTDIFGRSGGTAPEAYIRESRRLAKPVVRVLEQHISVPSSSIPGVRAPVNFSDSCGVCMYEIDVHQIFGPPGTPWVGGITVRPFQIPLGALIATDASNVIAGCKNIGATHLTSGAYRVHPGEWAVGEAAGTLAAYCAGQNVLPAQAHANPFRIAALQLRLLERGAPIFWWDDVTYAADQKVFTAANLLGVRGYLCDPNSLHFRPNDTISQSERDAVDSHAGRKLPWPGNAMSRGQAAIWLCAEIGLPSSEVVENWNSS